MLFSKERPAFFRRIKDAVLVYIAMELVIVGIALSGMKGVELETEADAFVVWLLLAGCLVAGNEIARYVLAGLGLLACVLVLGSTTNGDDVLGSVLLGMAFVLQTAVLLPPIFDRLRLWGRSRPVP